MAQDAVGDRAVADRLEEFVRQRVLGAHEAHRVGRHQRQLHALGDGHQAAIDQFFGGVAVEGELQVQPARVQLHQPPRQAIGFDRLGGVRRCSMAADSKPPPPGIPVSAIRPSLVGLQILQIHTRPSAVGAAQKPAIREANQRQPA